MKLIQKLLGALQLKIPADEQDYKLATGNGSQIFVSRWQAGLSCKICHEMPKSR